MGSENDQWYVQDGEGEAVGPVGPDLVIRGIRAGKIPLGSKVRRDGEDAWRPLTSEPDFANAATLIVSPDRSTSGDETSPSARERASRAQSGSSGKPVPGGAKRRNRWVAFFAVLGVLVAAAAGGGVVVWKRAKGARPVLPIPAAKFPPRTTGFIEMRLRVDREDLATLPPQYIASSLAAIACGGSDVARSLALARGAELKEVKSLGVLDLAGDTALRGALQCGEQIRPHLVSPMVVQLMFIEGDEPMFVNVVRATMNELPPTQGFVRRNLSGLDGYCMHPADAKDECPAGTHAAVHDQMIWAFGRLESVTAFARSLASNQEELSTSVDLIAAASKESAKADITEIRARPEGVPWKAVCERVAPIGKHDDFLKICFPPGTESAIRSTDAKVRGLAVQRDVLATASSYRESFVLVTRDDDDGKAVEKDLQELAREWRAHVSNTEPDLVKMLSASTAYTHDRLWASAMDPFLRALRSPKIERSGNVIRFTFDEAFRPAEGKALREYVATRGDDDAAATQIIDALLQKLPIPERALAAFLGPELAAWALAPRATEADCKAINDKLMTLTGDALPPEQFGLKIEMEQRFAAAKCVGAVLPTETKVCLAAASALPAFASCKLPSSPFVMAAAKRLEGQWEVAAVAGAKSTPSAARALTNGTKLEFANGRVFFAFMNRVSDGDASVESSDLDAATFALPLDRASVRKGVSFVDTDSFRIVDFAEGIEVLFKRAKFARPLAQDAQPQPAGGASR